MPTQIITGDNANEATFSGASDGAFTLRVGPNGAKVDGLAVDATGNVDVLAGITQQGGEAVPRMKQFTAKATTSGTFVDFTGIPSWAKKITVMLSGVSTNGTTSLQVQLGTSGGVQTTGYISSSNTTSFSTTGLLLTSGASAANNFTGAASISLLSGSTWVSFGTTSRDDANTYNSAGGVTLAGVLYRIRLTTVNGTDTFDAGSVNIMWE